MEYDFRVFRHLPDGFQLSDFSGNGVNFFALITEDFEQARIVPGIVTNKGGDFGSKLDESLD
jgi:hypothetical protein